MPQQLTYVLVPAGTRPRWGREATTEAAGADTRSVSTVPLPQGPSTSGAPPPPRPMTAAAAAATRPAACVCACRPVDRLPTPPAWGSRRGGGWDAPPQPPSASAARGAQAALCGLASAAGRWRRVGDRRGKRGSAKVPRQSADFFRPYSVAWGGGAGVAVGAGRSLPALTQTGGPRRHQDSACAAPATPSPPPLALEASGSRPRLGRGVCAVAGVLSRQDGGRVGWGGRRGGRGG